MICIENISTNSRCWTICSQVFQDWFPTPWASNILHTHTHSSVHSWCCVSQPRYFYLPATFLNLLVQPWRYSNKYKPIAQYRKTHNNSENSYSLRFSLRVYFETTCLPKIAKVSSFSYCISAVYGGGDIRTCYHYRIPGVVYKTF